MIQDKNPFVLDHQDLYLICIDAIKNKPCSVQGYVIMSELEESTHIPVLAVSHMGGCRFSPNIIDSKSGYQHGGIPNQNMRDTYIKSIVSHTIYAPLYRGNIYWNLSEQEELIQYAIDHIKSIYNEHDIILDTYIEEASGAIKISFRGVSVLYSVSYLQEISHGMSCSSDTKPVEFMNWRFSTVEII